MILYQDTSSIVKRYVRDEKGIQETREAVERADFAATSLLTYAEAHSAFARARREGRFVYQDEYLRVLQEFHRDWRRYIRVSLSDPLVRLAGDLAEKHALRGYDAVHLASALTLRDEVPDTIALSAWDEDLRRAASAEGLAMAHAGS